jgi:hypothetical protein
MRLAGVTCTTRTATFPSPSDASSTASYPPWFHAIGRAHASKMSGTWNSFGSKLLTGVAGHDSTLLPAPQTLTWTLLRACTACSISTKKPGSKAHPRSVRLLCSRATDGMCCTKADPARFTSKSVT